jgi:hypothetical protein
MPKATWCRTLTITAAQLREQAALEDTAAAEVGADLATIEAIRRRARAYREAALLLDDAETIVAGVQGRND